MKFLFQAEMADIEKTQWQSFKMEFKTLFTFLDTWVIWPFLKCLESTFFSVFIYIIKDTTFVKPYISHYLSAKIFFLYPTRAIGKTMKNGSGRQFGGDFDTSSTVIESHTGSVYQMHIFIAFSII